MNLARLVVQSEEEEVGPYSAVVSSSSLQTSCLRHFLLGYGDASLFPEVRAAVTIWPSGLFSCLHF